MNTKPGKYNLPSRDFLAALASEILASAAFLSRLPLGRFTGENLPDFRKSAPTFGLAGLIVALPAVTIFLIAAFLSLPPFVTAIFTLATLVVTTGALHEDGLADVADGFWGGHEKEKKLTIMRDSTIGTYGALALIFTVALRISAFAVLMAAMETFSLACLLAGIIALSRAFIVWPWRALPAARLEQNLDADKEQTEKDASGLSARYGQPSGDAFLKTMLCALPAFLLIVLSVGAAPALLALVCAALASYGLMRLAEHHIGGHTGDVLGATQQISEIGLYVGLLIAM